MNAQTRGNVRLLKAKPPTAHAMWWALLSHGRSSSELGAKLRSHKCVYTHTRKRPTNASECIYQRRMTQKNFAHRAWT
jgi:hypothetical protein